MRSRRLLPAYRMPRGEPQVRGHQPAVPLLVLDAEVVLDLGLVRLQRADQHVGLHRGLVRERAAQACLDLLGLGGQVGRTQPVRPPGRAMASNWPDAAGLDRLDLQPGQAEFEPVRSRANCSPSGRPAGFGGGHDSCRCAASSHAWAVVRNSSGF